MEFINPYALILERLEENSRRLQHLEQLLGSKVEDTSNHLLTKKQAAQLLNVPPSFIESCARNGLLERRSIGPNTVRFLRTDVEALPGKLGRRKS